MTITLFWPTKWIHSKCLTHPLLILRHLSPILEGIRCYVDPKEQKKHDNTANTESMGAAKKLGY